MDNEKSSKGWTLQIQGWHILFLLAVQLIALGVAYGRIAQAQEQQHEDIQHIESQRVITKEDFDDWKAELTGRIDRLENKLDKLYGKEVR